MSLLQKIVTIVFMQCLLLSMQPVSAEVMGTTYYHNDVLGSPIAATDESGNLKWRESYHPYGDRVTNNPEASKNSRWYTGHVHDQETGLTYAGARYYDPIVGRFMAIDPVGFNEANPTSFNRYAYANNNPYKYKDPNGNIPVDTIWDGISIVYDVAKIGFGYALDNPRLVSEGAVDLAADTTALFIPYVPAGSTKLTRAVAKKAADIKTPYKRPSGATTKAQRESVQNKPCVDCGATTPKQVADHKTPLVKEYYETGAIDKTKMRSLDAVQPQCPTCSARQGAEMSRYSRQQKKDLGL